MPARPELSEMLAITPEAEQAFGAIVETERIITMPPSLIGNAIVGVIPADSIATDIGLAAVKASERVSMEHERVLCARYGHELDEDIDPTPDTLARNYLFRVGLLNPEEQLAAEEAV
jgi:hypothetical protein